MLNPLDPTADLSHPRTQAMVQRLRKAMCDIESEIADQNGIYPYNYGRVTQSELCRRADVKKATLQTPLHKDTTRVEVMAWLERLSAQLASNRDATRQKVTAVADELAEELQILRSELTAAKAQITALQEENSRLKKTSGLISPATSSVRFVHRLQIQGKVQGVYYRASMIDEALRLGVTGWVRNRLDGSVEATACGTSEQLEQLTGWARRGPPAAIVTDVVVAPSEGEFSGFVQWPTV